MTFRGSLFSQKPVTRLTFFVRESLLAPLALLRAFPFIVRRFPIPRLPFQPPKSLHFLSMTLPAQPNVKLQNAPDYREAYANSVQMRVNVWDFFMVFGTLQQQTEAQVEIRNFQGIYLSPQQAKALLGLLQQNVSGYESAFGEIKLDPRMNPTGPVH
jgi:Protein of unknown function (DUF3467)